MTQAPGPNPAAALQRLASLCVEGQQAATYLFQVPDDQAEWERVRKIVDELIAEASKTPRRELPKLAKEMRELLRGPGSPIVAEHLLSSFDRVNALLRSAKSGLFPAL